MEIFPSLISSDLLDLRKTLNTFDNYCDGYHIDVMDDHFVPNLTWGYAFINAILNETRLPLHIHLMVDDPENFIARLKFRVIDIFCFHYESFKSDKEILSLIDKLKSKNIKIGIVIKPKTKPESVAVFLKYLDQVLIMSVEPGFSGQHFIDDVIYKISFFKKIKEANGYNFKIAIDGGINHSNIQKLYTLGVEQFAVASAIFNSSDPVESLSQLYKTSN